MSYSLRLQLRAFVSLTAVLASSVLANAAQVGVWQFNNSLSNAIGGKAPLTVLGGWTPSYVNETIGGSPATALSFPKFTSSQGITMTNEGSANGPIKSASTNNWSIVMDLNFPGIFNWTSLYETGDLGSSDGDYFIRYTAANPDRAIGIGSYAGSFPENTWTRLAVTVDTVTTPGQYTVRGYLDGVLTSTSTTDTAPGGRQGIREFLHLFADNDIETSSGLVNSVAFYGETLDAGVVGTLGGATAAGVPSAPNQAGLWNFQNNLNNSIGGRAPMAAVGGWTPSYLNATIAGSPATVLSFPLFDETQALDMPNQAAYDSPAITSNLTNQWSVVMDVKFPTLSGFTSIFQTAAPGANDGDYFIRDDSAAGLFGGIGISSNYQGVFNADTWTRLAVTVDGSAEGPYRITGYIDGVPVGTAVSTGTAPDGRFAIDEFLHFFNDEDNETSAGLINSLAYYDEVLTPEAVLALGGATAAGLAVTAPVTDADFNNDGSVDGADFLIWQRGFGINSGATNAQGDADLNGQVNSADLTLWKASFGGTQSVAAAGAVPEPGSLGLAILALAALATRKTRPGVTLTV
jgi:hypothetical protein